MLDWCNPVNMLFSVTTHDYLTKFSVGLMEREVLKDMTLIDPSTKQPIHLKRGETVMISPKRMRDSTVYTNPDTYDGYRFYKLRFGPSQGADAPAGGADHWQSEDSKKREPIDRRNLWQLVSMSPDHLGFGIGGHACPGRFFVANEVKIALCHLIMKYDWKLGAEKPRSVPMGNIYLSDPRAKIVIKRREVSYAWM